MHAGYKIYINKHKIYQSMNEQFERRYLGVVQQYDGSVFLLTYISLATFCETNANSADPVQTPHNAASDRGLYCLLTDFQLKFE